MNKNGRREPALLLGPGNTKLKGSTLSEFDFFAPLANSIKDFLGTQFFDLRLMESECVLPMNSDSADLAR
jgi:hypothetical protein